MAKQKCQKCGKIWNGWAQPDICPNCGAKLENVDVQKEEEKKTKENVKKIVGFK